MTIDREIAEKVMGWDLVPETKHFVATYVDDVGNTERDERDWQPSTNIEHAMEVEAEMFRRGFAIKIFRASPTDPDWIVYFDDGTTATFPSLPEAICRAALAALSAIKEK